jgi:AraC family transcriptional activator of pobA
MDQQRKGLDDLNMKHIPTYALYGERADQQEWLHWETIPARSRLHGFHIDQHRHENLMQILVLEAGSAAAQLDGLQVTLAPGDLVLVPAMVVHEYRFSEDVDGMVITLFEGDARALGFSFDRAAVVRDEGDISARVHQLIDEVRQPGLRHALVLNALLTLLLASIQRQSLAASALHDRADRAHDLTRKFRELVEHDYRSRRSVAGYAEGLGISHTHLNRVCQSVLGASAQAIINRRVATEARRYLLFSDLPVKVVAGELGFEDPAYFARFVKRHLGKPPAAVRDERFQSAQRS